jgi:signal peptidase I
LTPLELLGLIIVLGVLRVVLSVRPSPVGAGGTIPATMGGEAAPQAPQPSTVSVVKEYLDAFIVAGLVALFLITFVVRTFFIPSASMVPTLMIHDVLLANEFEYKVAKPHDQDIVVFTPPVETTNDFIKRLMGSPGETFRIHQGVVYRNGVALKEPYIAQQPAYELEIKNYGIYVDGTPLDPSQANIPPKSKWTSPDTIPPGCYFMMGDNRNDSEDSHMWGFAQTSGTFYSGQEAGKPAGFTGHAFFIFWPFDRIRVLH